MSAATITNPGVRLDTTQAMGNLGDAAAAAAQKLNQGVALLQLDAVYTGQTATFTSDGVDLGVGGTLNLTQTVANIGGTSTPTITTAVQTSEDGSTWRASFSASTSGSLAAATANGSQRKTFCVDRYVRFVFTISGTNPTFDITLSGQIRGF